MIFEKGTSNILSVDEWYIQGKVIAKLETKSLLEDDWV